MAEPCGQWRPEQATPLDTDHQGPQAIPTRRDTSNSIEPATIGQILRYAGLGLVVAGLIAAGLITIGPLALVPLGVKVMVEGGSVITGAAGGAIIRASAPRRLGAR